MLSPSDRTLLLESLRPPAGYRLDRAIATSYSLDLIALLTAPLAFTFFDWENDAGQPSADPLALLEAVRRHSNRIHVFCQAGGIKLPQPGKTLLAYLEQCVVEVRAPKPDGLFHPKVWILRFVGDEPPVRYRLLCLSRNLTFDRSWDTALVLDGELTDRERAIKANHRLGDFIAALPGMAVSPLPPDLSAAVDQVQDEIRRVRFELPGGIEELAFWPLGLDGTRAIPIPAGSRRVMVVSPFLSGSLLERLAEDRPPGILVSRPEALAQLDSSVLARFAKVFVPSPDAEPEILDEVEVAPDEQVQTSVESSGKIERVAVEPSHPGDMLSGLHAKLFVMDDGWNASVWTGSANATESAFGHNVEFLVELRGKKSDVGVDALMVKSDGRRAAFADLFKEWSGTPTQPDAAETERKRLELLLGRFACDLASAELAVHVEALAVVNGEPQEFAMRLLRRGPAPVWPEGLSLRCWPASLRTEGAVELAPGLPTTAGTFGEIVCEFPRVSFDAMTSFIAFDARLKSAGVDVAKQFALNLPLIGAPADRRQRLLLALLSDKEQVLRLLWILLARQDLSATDLAVAVTDDVDKPAWMSANLGGFPVLEAMLDALDRDPEALAAVDRLIEDLSRTPEGRALLPDGLAAIWAPINRVRRARRTPEPVAERPVAG